VLAAIDPKIDTQVDGRLSQAIGQHQRLGIAQHRRMVRQHLERDFLRFVDRIVVTDANIKLSRRLELVVKLRRLLL
jgi:hypothetical protein